MSENDELKQLAAKVVDNISFLLSVGDYNNAKAILKQSRQFRNYDSRLNDLCLISDMDDWEKLTGKTCTWPEKATIDELLDKLARLQKLLKALDENIGDSESLDALAREIISGNVAHETIDMLAITLCKNENEVAALVWKRIEDELYPLPEDGPLVSVIITCYNHEKFVAEAIDSVMNQTYKNIELIISDDGSADNSRQVIEECIKKWNTDRITFLAYEKNTCFGAAEDVYGGAKGKYITGIGGDDKIFPEKIARQVSFLERNADSYKACFTWVKSFGDNDMKIQSFDVLFNKPNISNWMLFKIMVTGGNQLNAPSFLMLRSVWEELGGYDFSFRQLQDYDLWVRFLLKYRLFLMPEKLTGYRVVSGSVSDSMVSYDAAIRVSVEAEYIIHEMMEIIPDDLLVWLAGYEQTGDLTDNDIRCIKVKFLLEHSEKNHDFCYGSVGFSLFHQYRRIPGFKEMLDEKYGISRKDIHRLAVEVTPANYLMRFQRALIPYETASEKHRLDLTKLDKTNEEYLDELKQCYGKGEKAFEDGTISADHLVVLYDACKGSPDGFKKFVETIEKLKN